MNRRSKWMGLLALVAVLGCGDDESDTANSSDTGGGSGATTEASATEVSTTEASTTEASTTDGDTDASTGSQTSTGAIECQAFGESCSPSLGPCCEGTVCDGMLVPTCIVPGECLPPGAQCLTADDCCDDMVCDGMEVTVCGGE